MKLETNYVYLPVFIDSPDEPSLVGFFGLNPDHIEPIKSDVISGPEGPITMQMRVRKTLESGPYKVFARGFIFKEAPNSKGDALGATQFSERWIAQRVHGSDDWFTQHQLSVLSSRPENCYQAYIGFAAYVDHLTQEYSQDMLNGSPAFEPIIGELLQEMSKCKFTEKVLFHNKAVMAFEDGVSAVFDVSKEPDDAPAEKSGRSPSDLYDSVQQAVNEVRAVTKDSEKQILVYFKSGDARYFMENEILIITDAWPFLPSFYPPQVKHLINHSSIERVEVADLDEALKKTEARHASRQK